MEEYTYHISDIQDERVQQMFRSFEDEHPFPVSVMPNIPQGQQLGTIDKLAQAVVPKLVDKLNVANWQIQRLEALCNWQSGALLDVYDIINNTYIPALTQLEERIKALEKGEKKPAKPRARKKSAVTVDMSEIADYDPDTDSWNAMVIDGHRITGALIDVIEHLNGAAGAMYSDELIDFIGKLEPQVKQAIAARFPN